MKELIRHILKEETEEIDQKVMNFLLRRYQKKEIDLDTFKFKTIYFNVDGDYYSISDFDNKKRQVRVILNMLEEKLLSKIYWNFCIDFLNLCSRLLSSSSFNIFRIMFFISLMFEHFN